MYSRTYIIGQHESTECPWCAMPLHDGEHAIEIVSEHPDKDCIQEGFCCHTCARNWMHSLKGELIKAVDDWVAGHRPIVNNLSIDARKGMGDNIRH